MAASLSISSCKILLFCLFFFLFSSFQFAHVDSIEFEVGDKSGWAVPSKNNEMYNDWAEEQRFQINDTIHFKYEKDSVLVVTDQDYKKCSSSHPLFFSNNGDTLYTLDRSGLFYFISGIAGHCGKGQKMIIKVLEPANPPPPGSNRTSSPPSPNAAVEMAYIPWSIVIAQFIMSALVFFSFI